MSTIAILEQFSLVRRQINRLALFYVKDMDLGPKQMHVLRFVHKNGKASMGDIAHGISSDKAAVTRMVNSLVGGKYLSRASSKTDQRETLVSLGPKAKPIVLEIERVYQRLSEQLSGGLSVQEREDLSFILKKIETRVQKTIDAILNEAKVKES